MPGRRGGENAPARPRGPRAAGTPAYLPGTRAAAFMYMEMTRSIPAPREMLVLDRPFAFAIKNDKGVVYFTGEVVNPLMM